MAMPLLSMTGAPMSTVSSWPRSMARASIRSAIFDDVDLETAVANALFGLYMNTGQICSAGTRILVQDTLYDRFVSRFVERSREIKIGDPLDFATRMGPLVSEEQLRKVQRYVEIG